jgi:hypothetical protein
MEKIDTNFDMYELLYRDYKNYQHSNNQLNIDISENTTKTTWDILKEFKTIKPGDMEEIKFSDLSYNLTATTNEETNALTYTYIPICENKNINELIHRFRKLDINKLPLIEVAKYLNIKIEKSMILRVLGRYNLRENKITLGSDYEPTFIHELVHAIDHILPNYNDELCHGELVAELSAVVLCRVYNIQFNLSYSLMYLNWYTSSETNIEEIIKRVSLIYEYIKACIVKIKSKKNLPYNKQ